jgi:repressor LexA
MKLTRRQREILDFVSGFIEQNGYSPSMEEIADHFHFASLNTVFKHLEALEKRGYLNRDSNRARSIQLSAQSGAGVRNLPLLGSIAAGLPFEAVATSESLPVPDYFLPGRGNFYALRVKGESMIDDHIQDGDFVIVESRDAANTGETVVALVDGDNVTLKKFFPEGDNVRLQPANESVAPIVVKGDRVRIQGVVVCVMRRYR